MKRLLLAAALALLPFEAAAQNTFFAASPGDMIYRGPSGWAPVPGAQAGAILQSQGPTVAPAWTFDLSSVSQLKLPFMTTNAVLGNVTGGNANPTPITQTQFLDTLGYDIVRPPTIGAIPMKASFGVNGSWQALQPGPAGYVLQSNGAGADLTWAFNPTTATPGSAGLCLVSTGPTTPPVYAICPVTSANLTATAPLALSYGTPTNLALTGIVPVANGGTGVATITSNGVVVGAGTAAITTKTGTAGQVFMSIGGVPTFTSTPSIATSLTVPSIATQAITTATMTATSSVATGQLTVTGNAYHTGSVNSNTTMTASGSASFGQITANGPTFATGNVNSNGIMTASTSIVAPIVYGGSAVGSTLALRPTSGAGSGGARVNIQGGTNGALQLGEFSGITASSSLALGASGSIAGQLLLNGNTSGAVTVKPQAAAGNWQFILPNTPGLNNQVLTSSGGGAMTWATPTTTSVYGANPNFINGNLVVSAAAGALTVAVKTNAGADPSAGDPVTVVFPNNAALGGNTLTISLTAANSVVIPSTATMGFAAATATRLWVVGFRDTSGPTFRLGVWNGFDTLNIFPLVEGSNTSTTISAAADNAGIIYTNTGVTNMPMIILGYIEWNASGIAVPGTWTTTNLFKTQLLTPGGKLPGDVVRSYFMSDNTGSATVSPTYVATNTTQAVILSSAANVVRLRAMGSITIIDPTQTANVTLLRGATALNAGTLLYNQDLGGAQILSVPATLVAQDFPNTISSTTYSVGIAAAVAGTGVTWNVQLPGGAGFSTNANLEIQEIMR